MAQRKGAFGVDWGALGDIVQGVVLGEPERIVKTLTGDETPTEPAPPPEPHEPNSPACDARDDGYHCSGHSTEGHCIMVKDG